MLFVERPPEKVFRDRLGRKCIERRGVPVPICAAPRHPMPRDYPCLNRAGARTSHLGWGRCKLHEVKGEHELQRTPVDFLDLAVNKINDPTLKTALEEIRTVRTNDLFSQDILMKIIMSVLVGALSKKKPNDAPFDENDGRYIAFLTEHARKIQETAIHRQQAVEYSPENVKLFVRNIFGDILQVLEEERVSERVAEKILSKFERSLATSFQMRAQDASFRTESEEDAPEDNSGRPD